MTNLTMKEMDRIGVMMHNASLWGMAQITVERPADETIKTIESLGYEVKDLSDVIRITLKK